MASYDLSRQALLNRSLCLRRLNLLTTTIKFNVINDSFVLIFRRVTFHTTILTEINNYPNKLSSNSIAYQPHADNSE